jgi:hypothetical protein
MGAELSRQGRRHEIWVIPETHRATSIPRHRGEVPTGTLHRILRDLGLGVEDLPV